MEENTLEALRVNIDELDGRILELISQRAQLAQQVVEVKEAEGNNDSYYRPEREARILRRIIAENKGPLASEELAQVFREIISACRALEQSLNIGFLGPEGTFTHTAALKHFGHAIETTPLDSIDEVFRAVESGICQFGVVPVENSIEGVVSHTIDMFVDSPLNICAEIEQRIHHHLLSSENSLDAVNEVYAHQQALGQCRLWLNNHLTGVRRVPVSSNAEAARIAVGKPGAAAIAGDAAAELYELNIVQPNIEDRTDNTTRFLVIGKRSASPGSDDKTSLLFTTTNKPGALFNMLAAFADNGISMLRIESRPSRPKWDYFFFVDIQGHEQDEVVAKALKELKEKASMVKLLGSYPRAVL